MFKPKWNHGEHIYVLKETVSRSSELFVKHFSKYDEELPPLWVICEIMTLGQLSKWYANLQKSKDRNAIAHVYNLDEVNLTSFLHHLSIVRNTCAHHARLWNRSFPIAWKLPRKRPSGMDDDFNRHDGKHLYNTLIMLSYLMDRINQNTWKKRLGNLFVRHPDVKAQAMGFPDDLPERPFWCVFRRKRPLIRWESGHHSGGKAASCDEASQGEEFYFATASVCRSSVVFFLRIDSPFSSSL